MGIKHVLITSAFELSTNDIDVILRKHSINASHATIEKKVDPSIIGGYIVQYDGTYIDRTLRTRIYSDNKDEAFAYGTVQEVKDGVATVSGLESVGYGEILTFENGARGLIVDLLTDSIGVIVLGDYTDITAGSIVRSTGDQLHIGVGDAMLGRVVNALGNPVDEAGEMQTKKLYPVEKVAPGVVSRRSVSVPLQTGIKVIDALIPIGRGQRELIIGDRGTGKTTLCLDTIINQRDTGVICIYCAIGQKNSKIAASVELLRQRLAHEYTVVVKASASDPVAMQYIAPYSATAIAEYFMDQGKDVLIVYDDLTKHAYAYRQISLILRRPAGREAYPGDVFYLHSRLLERSCRLSEEKGGGSITALPIIETLENDISAYIPTNVISITDGQIFLETDLFNAGVRPAVNVGVSVSRVGGAAQTKAMKQVAGRLKLDLAQYRELAAFSQFESELDAETKKFLNRGAKAAQILKQEKNNPYDLASQVAVLWAVSNGVLDEIETQKVNDWEERFLSIFHQNNPELREKINSTKVLDPADEKQLIKISQSV
jgi:F-type H+-transporting ATPase subunit alpha